MELGRWWDFLCEQKLMVAPLVFRNHAVFQSESSDVWVSAIWEGDKQFLNPTGEYLVAQSKNATRSMGFLEAHTRLLPLGAHIAIRRRALAEHGLTCVAEYVIGCLRYPEADVSEEEELYKVYVLVQHKAVPDNQGAAVIVAVPPTECRILPSGDRNVCTHVVKG